MKSKTYITFKNPLETLRTFLLITIDEKFMTFFVTYEIVLSFISLFFFSFCGNKLELKTRYSYGRPDPFLEKEKRKQAEVRRRIE